MEKGPEKLTDILGRLFVARGWGRRQGRLHLEQAWEESVSEKYKKTSRVSGLRRGVLEVEVANSVLLQELAHFHKRKLLQELRRRLPQSQIKDLRFRAGSWQVQE